MNFNVPIPAYDEDGFKIVDYWRKAKESDQPRVQLRLREGVTAMTPRELDGVLTAFLWQRVRDEIGRWESENA